MPEHADNARSLSPHDSLFESAPAFSHFSASARARLLALGEERTYSAGEALIREGDHCDHLFLIRSGEITRSRALRVPHAQPIAGQGELCGEFSFLTGQASPETISAATPVAALLLSTDSFRQLSSERPAEIAQTLRCISARIDAHQIATAIEDSQQLGELPHLIRLALAERFERHDSIAGETLFREGDSAQALYVVLSGRVRLSRRAAQSDSPEQTITEAGKGDLLGEISLLAGQPHSTTAIAIRDSHLAQLDKSDLVALASQYPAELYGLFARQFAVRLNQPPAALNRSQGKPPVAITVLPLSPAEQNGGAREFTAELVCQLSAFGPTLHLTRAVMDRLLRNTNAAVPEDSELSRLSQRALLAWLDDMEMLYHHVVYEADYQTGVADTPWTTRCLRQADVLLAVASAQADPQQREKTMVRLTRKAIPTVQATLVLVHDDAVDSGPGQVRHTALWKQVLGFTRHEHVRRNPAGRYHPDDVSRIARSLNHRSVGLALGGGFALGLAHIGVIDAMRDLGIPIDCVGGTSMGAIIAAAAAQQFTHDQMLEVMDHGCAQALKGDYTLPVLSLLTGKKVTAALGKYLEGIDVEDLWLPYFAISASLVHARMIVHRTGSALRSVLASCRAPGMFPPLGWNGDVLVDGGLVNNNPADVMRDLVGDGTVIAIDVSPDSHFTSGQEFGMDVSGWHVARRNFSPLRRLRNRFRSRTSGGATADQDAKRLSPPSTAKMATLPEVLMRLIRLGGVAHNQQIRDSADLYLSLPLDQFSVKDFQRGEEMASVAYTHARHKLEAWIEQHGRPWLGQLPPAKENPGKAYQHPAGVDIA